MTTFRFRTVPDIVCKAGALLELPGLLSARFPKAKRLLIVTDKGVAQQPFFQQTLKALNDAGYICQIDKDVIADPPEAVVLEAADRARDFHTDVVIGLGGGSSMDVAKLVAVLAGCDQALSTMYGIDNCKGPRLPLVQIPTSAGTGSEVTPIAIVTTGETTKMGVVSAVLYADIAILDAHTTLSLPPAVTAATGIDAMVHAIEAYTTRHLKNPYSDLLATQALRLLSAHLLIACKEGGNVQARQAMLLGAMLAGQAFANAPCAAVHALAYPLGGYFHLSHGLSNAMVLGEVLKFNKPSAHAQYSELAGVVLGEQVVEGMTTLERCDAFIDYCSQLNALTGLPTQLRQVGISASDIETLASSAMLQTRLLNNNPREVTQKDAFEIYSACL